MNQKRQSGVAEGSEFAGFCLESAIGRVSESGLWVRRSCLCVNKLDKISPPYQFGETPSPIA